MDIRPKRNRDKDNPYTLQSQKDKNIYRVSFSDGVKEFNIEISKELFEGLDELEKEDARQIQRDKRYREKSQLTEISLYKRVSIKPNNTEEDVIKKTEFEKLYKAINELTKTQRRRILLYFEYNLTLEEIAKIEGRSKISIRESIQSALEQLKKKF